MIALLQRAWRQLLKRSLRLMGYDFRFSRAKRRSGMGQCSLFDEEQIISRYIAELDPAHRNAVDIGAKDGLAMSNTFALYERGWQGLAVECHPAEFSELAYMYLPLEQVQLSRCKVKPDNVIALLAGHEVPKEFGFLNLDIDGYLGVVAHNAISANEDWLHDDYCLYRDPSSGRWTYVPWDLHETWDSVRRDIDLGTRWNPNLFFEWNRLLDQVLSVPSLHRRYTEKLSEWLEGHLSPAALRQVFGDRLVQMSPDMNRDVYKESRETSEGYVSALEDLFAFFGPRVDFIESDIERIELPEHVLVHLCELVPAPGGAAIEAIEIRNLANRPFDLHDFALSDDGGDPLKWLIDPQTIEPAGRALVALPAPVATGGWIGLFRDIGGDAVEVDAHSVPATLRPGRGYGRFPESSGRWHFLDAPSPGDPNQWTSPAALDVCVKEPLEEQDCDGIATPGETVEIALEATHGGEWAVDGELRFFVRSREGILDDPDPLALFPMHLEPGAIETLVLEPPVNPARWGVAGYHLLVQYVAADGDVWASDEQEVFVVGDPAFPVVVNELMASNDTTHADEAGEYDDWLELYNASDAPVALTGLHLTDDPEDRPFRWELPARTMAPRERLIVWCDGDTLQSDLHAPFKLSARGESIALVELGPGPGGTLRDYWVFGPQQSDVSIGRYPDGNPSWVTLDDPSPAEGNSYTPN